jgi:zinc/manganese transport system permease protein
MFASFMINAWEAATMVAAVAGVVGFFTVLRGAAFAAHSLPNGAFAGAAGAFLIGANTIVGLGVFSLAGAGMIAGLGRRARSDVATALTIVLMLALGDLFLSRTSEYAPEIFSLLFGEVLGVSASKLAPTAVIAVVCIVAVIVLYRPLMLSSVAPDVAEARGINTRVMDLAFLVVLALVTTMAVPVVGSLLIFSLLIGPPAAARSFTNRPPVAMALSVVFALVTMWVAIAVSYETNLPIGFFVGATSAFAYAVGRAWAAWQQKRGRRQHSTRDQERVADLAERATTNPGARRRT